MITKQKIRKNRKLLLYLTNRELREYIDKVGNLCYNKVY